MIKLFFSSETYTINEEEDEYFRIVFCNHLEGIFSCVINNKDYGNNIISEFAIIPTMMPTDSTILKSWKERSRYTVNNTCYEARIRISYEDYSNADKKGKKKIMVENIIESLRRIEKTSAKKYNYKELIIDFQEKINEIMFYVDENYMDRLI